MFNIRRCIRQDNVLLRITSWQIETWVGAIELPLRVHGVEDAAQTPDYEGSEEEEQEHELQEETNEYAWAAELMVAKPGDIIEFVPIPGIPCQPFNLEALVDEPFPRGLVASQDLAYGELQKHRSFIKAVRRTLPHHSTGILYDLNRSQWYACALFQDLRRVLKYFPQDKVEQIYNVPLLLRSQTHQMGDYQNNRPLASVFAYR